MKKTSTNIAKSEATAISGKKKVVFNILILVLSFLLLFVLEFGLKVFDYGKDLSLFIKSTNYPGYYEINRNTTLRYFTKLGNTSVTSDIFLIEKPDTAFRIFVLGGSTTRGFPYQEGTAFPRILYYQLQDAFPNKRIEIINLSASAINSYSFIDMADEVFKSKPDALLIYGGHNEYYGALGLGSVENGGNVRWLKKLRLKLGKLRTFQLVQHFIGKTLTIWQKTQTTDATLMSRIVKDKDITYNSAVYNAGIEQFKANLTELFNKAKKNNVPIILSDLVSNTKDLAPFKSIQNEGIKSASNLYKSAQKQESLQNYDTAKELYYEAKDRDAIRFRAPEAFNELIYKLGKEYNYPVVPMKEYFEKNSPNRLIGDNLMLDHLHPNIDGYFLMADAFFATMQSNKLIDDNWDSTLIKPSAYYKNNWGFSELDSLIGDLNIKSLKAGWPFKPTNQVNVFLKTYKYNGVVDSMAFKYLTSTVRHIEDEHIKLAQFYSRNGLNTKAFKEYYALIKMHPYISDLYYDAVKYLLLEEKYNEAIQLIESAPLMKKDYYYYYMIGTIQFKIGKTQQSIENLKYAYQIITPDAKPTLVLIPLYVIYKSVNDKANELRVLELIQKYDPNFKPKVEGENSIIKTKISVDELYNLATDQVKQGEVSTAIEMLLVADKFEENFKVKKLLATLYIREGENDLALEYCLAAYTINPKDFDNLNNLFLLHHKNGNLDNSYDILMQMKSLNINSEKVKQLEAMYEQKKVRVEKQNN